MQLKGIDDDDNSDESDTDPVEFFDNYRKKKFKKGSKAADSNKGIVYI
jgi:hypothetical protein